MLKKFFDKNEVMFAVVCIIVYVVGMSAMKRISENIGIEFSAEAVFGILYFLLIAVFTEKNGLKDHLGLCAPQIQAKKMLYYIPLVLTASVSVIFGAEPEYGSVAAVLYTLQMLFVGIIEEIIFRGFLFRGMAKKNIRSAAIVSALTFGIGHIVNLFNGYEIFETAVQIIYAVSVGALLVVIFIRTGSIIPCIIFHSLNNILAGFGSASILAALAGSEFAGQLLEAGIRLVLTAAYMLYIMKAVPKGSALK